MVDTTTAASTARLDLAKMRKIALASVIGTTVEWYDLFVFGTASALVFNKILLPSFDPLVGTMLAFGTFASAYPGAVLVVDMDGDRRHAPVGAVTAAAAKAQGAAGIMVDGVATDLLELRSTGLPVFARGTSCLTTKRVHGTESAINVPVTCGGVDVAPGDWVLGDDNGVIVLSTREAAAVLEQALSSDAAEPELLARIAAGAPLETLLAH